MLHGFYYCTITSDMIRSDSDAITCAPSGSPSQAISQGVQGFPQTTALESDPGQTLCLGALASGCPIS